MAKSKQKSKDYEYTTGWYTILQSVIDFTISKPVAKPKLVPKVEPKTKWMFDRTAIIDLFPPRLPIVPRRQPIAPDLPPLVWEFEVEIDPDEALNTWDILPVAHKPIYSEPIPIPRNKGKWTPNKKRPELVNKWLDMHLIFYHNTCVKNVVDFSRPGRARDVYHELQNRRLIPLI